MPTTIVIHDDHCISLRKTRVRRNNHRALRRMYPYSTIWCNALRLLHPTVALYKLSAEVNYNDNAHNDSDNDCPSHAKRVVMSTLQTA